MVVDGGDEMNIRECTRVRESVFGGGGGGSVCVGDVVNRGRSERRGEHWYESASRVRSGSAEQMGRADRAIFFFATQSASQALNCAVLSAGGGAVSATRPVMLPMLPDPKSGRNRAEKPPKMRMSRG